MTDDDQAFMDAQKYDQMIPWERRLKREIPFIVDNFIPGKVFDVACASGRHSFALEAHGFVSFGVDISEPMIKIANNLKEQMSASSNFRVLDVTVDDFLKQMQQMQAPLAYDNAILLGNAIANMRTKAAGIKVLENIYSVLKPGGRFVTQTINRPHKAHYIALRSVERDDKKFIVQRIAVPVNEAEHNLELNVNVIDPDGSYESQSFSEMTWYTPEEFEDIVHKIGFAIVSTHGGYEGEALSTEGGATVVWVLERPDLQPTAATVELFEKYVGITDEKEMTSRIVKVWEASKQVRAFRCIQEFRYMQPRIASSAFFDSMVENIEHKLVLDVGCALGTDLRYLVVKGLPKQNAYGIDITDGFIRQGFEVFADEDGGPSFFAGDITKDEPLVGVNRSENVMASSFDDMFDLVHAGSVLHVLGKEVIHPFVTQVFSMLKEGGMFVGRVVGGRKEEYFDTPDGLRSVFVPESLKRYLEEAGFSSVEIMESTTEKIPKSSDKITYGSLLFKAVK